MVHAQSCLQSRTHFDKYFRTVTQVDIEKKKKKKETPEKDKKKSIGACLRSPRKDNIVEKKLAFSHF